MYLLLAVHLFYGKEAVTGSIIFSRCSVYSVSHVSQLR